MKQNKHLLKRYNWRLQKTDRKFSVRMHLKLKNFDKFYKIAEA